MSARRDEPFGDRAPKPGRGRPGASSALRSVLLVSPQFPPSPLVGAHRARHLAKHLGTHGWRPTVVTVEPDAYEERLDERLAALVPPETEILRVKALPKGLARRFGVGDVGLRAYAGLRRAVLERIAGRPPDLVFITGFPFYPMLMSGAVRRRGIPVVLDFQDPWVSAWGSTRPPLSKAGIAHRLACRLEPRAVAAASGILSVSAMQNRTMQARYPEIPAERWCDLPIGCDWDDYEAVAPRADEPGGRTFLYAGAFLPRSGEVLAAFFAAVAEARAQAPLRFAGVRFRFIGTAAVTDRGARKVVTPIAQANGVADLVEETPWRLPYLDALGLMRGSFANLLIGSDEAHYTASKIYPALMSRRPYLSIFHAASSAHAILARGGGGIALGFDERDPPAGLTPAIRTALDRMLTDADRFGPADPAMIEPYTADAIARRCAAFFDRIVTLEARGGASLAERRGRTGGRTIA